MTLTEPGASAFDDAPESALADWLDVDDRCSVSLVIPAMNEADNLRAVLPRLPRFIDEVILVDGSSTDATVATTRELCPGVVVLHEERRGKGHALRAGFAAATGDVIVMIDADGSMDPDEIWRFVAEVQNGFDLVKGSRFMEGGGSTDITFFRSAGNRVLRQMVNRMYQARFTDLCYGFMAFRRDCLPDLALAADGFEIETEIVVRAARAGLRVAEVPSFESERINGESNLRALRDGFRVLRTLVAKRFTRVTPASTDVWDDARTVIDLTDPRYEASPITR